MCANCGSTNLVAPPPASAPPWSHVIRSIVLALVGVVAGLLVGVLAIVAFATAAARAFYRRAYSRGWLLAGIAFGMIGPATACWLGLGSYGGVRPH